MSSNDILHRRVPPHHPSSSGLTENMVRSLKQALNKAHRTDSIEFKIARFLATYTELPLTQLVEEHRQSCYLAGCLGYDYP